MMMLSNVVLAANEIQLYDVKIKPDTLGKYEMYVEAHEVPSNEVLPIVDSSYFPVSSTTFTTKIDNTAPSATYEAKKIAKADVIFALGETAQASLLANSIASFTARMEAAGNYLDVDVKQVETSTIDMSQFGAQQIFETWRKMPESDGFGEKVWLLNMSEGQVYAEGNRTKSTGPHRSVMIIDGTEDGFKTTDFTMEFTHNTKGPAGQDSYRNVRNGWAPHISGCIFRYTEDTSKAWDAYMLVVGDTSTAYSSGTGKPYCAIIKINNGDPDLLPGSYASTLPVGWSAGVIDTSGALSNMRIDHQGLTYVQGQWCKGERNSRSDMLLIGARAIVNTESHDFKLEVTENNIKVYCGGILQLDLVDNYSEGPGKSGSKPYLNGTYGFFSFSSPNVYFSNVKITRGGEMSLGQAIQDVSWRSDATRFIIHSTDVVPDDFQEPGSANYLYTLAKLLDSNSYLINLGKESNREALDRMTSNLKDEVGDIKGRFFRLDNPGIVQGMDNAADYISEVLRRHNKPTQYILVGDSIIWETQYKDLEKDIPLNFGDNKDDGNIVTAWGIGTNLMGLFREDGILAEKWRFRHFPAFYDNDQGEASFNSQWMYKPIETFDKVGKYRINYKRKDNPFAPNASTSFEFDEYRKWSTDYDPFIPSISEEEKVYD